MTDVGRLALLVRAVLYRTVLLRIAASPTLAASFLRPTPISKTPPEPRRVPRG